MSISDIKKVCLAYFIFTIFVLIFSIIYESFSHQVYSIYMQYAFLVPTSGLITYIVFYKLKIIPNWMFINLFNASILTFTLGSIMEGFLNIYGTTNNLILVYIILGLALMFLSIVTFKKS